MKNKLGLRILLTSIALVTIAICTMVLSGLLTDRPKINKGNNGISLEAPFFISSAEAAQATDAFPADEAGISAYVKMGQTINIEKIKSILTEVKKVGDNYIIGPTPIPDLGGNIDVHLYVDKDGWLVAYLKADEPAAKIMQWGESTSISEIKSTTLLDALHKAGKAANVWIEPKDVKYYDFRFPEANSITIFAKKSGIVQIEIPATYTLYEASYYNYGAEIFVDGVRVSVTDRPVFDSYKVAIRTGKLHKIEIRVYSASYTVATVLIYKAQ